MIKDIHLALEVKTFFGNSALIPKEREERDQHTTVKSKA
jgi:hypothetical protein